MSAARPEPDQTVIAAALGMLFDPTNVVELRAIHKTRKRTDAGYFDRDHWADLAQHTARLNGLAAVYVTLNPVNPQLLARYSNRVKELAKHTAQDVDIILRRWFLIDLDSVRPADTSATDEQLKAAKAKAQAIRNYLQRLGWPAPLVMESGNGYHLLYPVDFPNDDKSRDAIKGALVRLAALFDDDTVKVDQTVFNAARIVKLYGTVANKGDHTPLAPWRLSRIVANPGRPVTVTLDQLQSLAPPAQEQAKRHPAHYGTRAPFDLPGFLSRLGIEYSQDQHAGRDRYKLAHCPFNPDHGKGEAAIFQDAAGVLGFKCVHNGCANKTWQDVRRLVDGSKESRDTNNNANRDEKAKRPVGAQDSGQSDGDEEWPEPQPLTAKIAPEPYPLDALPDTIRAAVEEVLGFVKAPFPLVANSALGVLSLAVQAHVDIKRAERLTGPSGLFLLAIADSGERKTTCDGFFTPAIRQYEAEQAELAGPVLKDHEAKMAARNAEREGLLSAIREKAKKKASVIKLKEALTALEHSKPEPPRVPKLLLGDETPENLAWVLAKRWPSGGVVSSEAGVVFGAHGMGKDSVMRNLSLLNVLWDGAELSIGRKTSESFTVKGARLTVALQIQETALRSFVERSGGLARGTGFLARFLVAWPESTQGYRPFTESPETWPRLSCFHRRIADILNTPAPIDDEGRLNPAMLSFTPEAKAAWVAFHDGIEEELRSGDELYDVRDVASKTADNAARLAEQFHVFEHGIDGAVGVDSFEGASRIAAWHLSESRRFFGELALPVGLANAARLESWLIEYCQRERTREVNTRFIQQYGPGNLRSKDVIDAAALELEELDRARVVKEGKRRTIQVNPALLAEGVK